LARAIVSNSTSNRVRAIVDAAPDFAVTESGSGNVLVVFVHGVLDRGRSFDRIADALSTECRLLQYDRRGYGASAGTTTPVGVDEHVDDLVTVLDGRRAVVVGHSFGGVPAMGAAVRAPELVAALVLYETSLAWVPGWDDEIMQGVFVSDDPERAALRVMLGDRYDALSDEDRARRRVDAAAFVAEEWSVRQGPPPFDPADIRAPVVYGRSSPEVMPVVVDHLASRLPQLEVMTLPGAGHLAHRSDPEAFAGLVRRGVARVR
jgi:pimeloyl-ACP methyl ester carboxylesterase